MSINKPLLSICIPTYCRAPYLQECLASLTKQFEQNSALLNMVEIVISDNASTDNTTEIVSNFQKKYNNIKYVRNDTNVGPDENYIHSVLKANGTYGWLMGDDDFIVQGGISFVVDFLQQNRVSVFTFDSKPFLHLEDATQRKNCSIDTSDISFFSSHDEFFQKGYCVGILCMTVFDRELWLKTDRTQYSPGWSYYEIELQMIAQSSLKMAHASYPLVIVREDCAWVKDGMELFTFINSNNVTKKMMTFGYDTVTLSESLFKNSKRIVIILLRAKGNGLDCNVKNLKYIYSNVREAGFFYLCLTTLVYVIPNSAIRAVRDIKKFI